MTDVRWMWGSTRKTRQQINGNMAFIKKMVCNLYKLFVFSNKVTFLILRYKQKQRNKKWFKWRGTKGTISKLVAMRHCLRWENLIAITFHSSQIEENILLTKEKKLSLGRLLLCDIDFVTLWTVASTHNVSC